MDTDLRDDPFRASRDDLVAQRVADAIEKSPATYRVTPAFGLGAPDIFAKIKEIGPLLVGRGLWRTSKGRLPAGLGLAGELPHFVGVNAEHQQQFFQRDFETSRQTEQFVNAGNC